MGFTDSNNCISNGLRADIMRSSMENKNLLSDKGSIYVGTGEKITTGGTSVAKTKALALGENGNVLISKGGDLVYGTLVDGKSVQDGLSLEQDVETGQLSLGGHINQVYNEDGSISVKSDGSFYGTFFMTDGTQLKHLYHHNVCLALSNSTSLPACLQGVKLTFDFINRSKDKYEDISYLANMPIGYIQSGTTDEGNQYSECQVMPDCCLVNNTKWVIFFYVDFYSEYLRSGEYSNTCSAMYLSEDDIGAATWKNQKDITTYISSITDTVKYVDTGDVVE